MRYVITALAALAVGGFFASAPAKAEAVYQPGGPTRIGNFCQVDTFGMDASNTYGYTQPCPTAQRAKLIKRQKKVRS